MLGKVLNTRVVLFICVVVVHLVSPQVSAEEIRISTGPITGTYYSVVGSIARAHERLNPGSDVILLVSQGSKENLERVYSGSADFGIVQHSDIEYAARNVREYPRVQARLKSVAILFDEAIHILVRPGLHIADLDALSGRNVNLGPQGSGTFYDAQAHLIAAGIIDRVQHHNLAFASALDSLKFGSVDAAFFTMTPYAQSKVRETLKTDSGIQLLSLRSGFRKRFVEQFPAYSPIYIEKGTYTSQPRDVATTAISAVLIANSSVPDEEVVALLSSLFSSTGDLPLQIADQISIDNAFGNLPVRYHPGALSYYYEYNWWERNKNQLQIIPGTMVLGILIWLLLLTRGLRAQRLRYISLVQTLILVAIIWIGGAIVMYFAEHDTNESFRSIAESSWAIATYLLSGFEEKFPLTTFGKLASVMIIAFGIGIVAYITADVASVLTRYRLSEVSDMSKYKDHYVICNWSPRGEKVITELHDKFSPERNSEIGVLTTSEYSPASLSKHSMDRVHFVEGDPASRQALERVGAKDAKAIIVLANSRSAAADGETAQIVINIWNMVREIEHEGRRRPRIVAEIVDPRKRDLLAEAHADEIICGENLAIGTLAQSALYPGISKVFTELLDYSGSSSEFYMIEWGELPEGLRSNCIEDKSFEEVGTLFLNISSQSNPTLLIGVQRKGKTILNPCANSHSKVDSFESIQAGDSLIFIAYEDPVVSAVAKTCNDYTHGMGKRHKLRHIGLDKFNPLDPDALGRHIIIFNWDDTGENIVQELHSEDSPARDVPILVFTAKPVDSRQYQKNPAFKDTVVFLSGDATSRKVLRRIGAHEAKSLIILPSEDEADPDGHSTLILLAIDQVCRESKTRPHVIAESLNHRKQEILRGAQADEIVNRDDYALAVMTHSIVHKQLSDVFYDLLDYNIGNELYVVPWEEMPDPVRVAYSGKEFVEIVKQHLSMRDEKNPTLPIGIHRNNSFIINPKNSLAGDDSHSTAFCEGDGLLVMANTIPRDMPTQET